MIAFSGWIYTKSRLPWKQWKYSYVVVKKNILSYSVPGKTTKHSVMLNIKIVPQNGEFYDIIVFTTSRKFYFRFIHVKQYEMLVLVFHRACEATNKGYQNFELEDFVKKSCPLGCQEIEYRDAPKLDYYAHAWRSKSLFRRIIGS